MRNKRRRTRRTRRSRTRRTRRRKRKMRKRRRMRGVPLRETYFIPCVYPITPDKSSAKVAKYGIF